MQLKWSANTLFWERMNLFQEKTSNVNPEKSGPDLEQNLIKLRLTDGLLAAL